MAFYPAHCDNICKGCEKNKGGWCIWKDRSICGVNASPNGHKLELKMV